MSPKHECVFYIDLLLVSPQIYLGEQSLNKSIELKN
jgi:hypothetical protein